MSCHIRHARWYANILAAIAILTMAACATTSDMVSDGLDPQTGVTFTYSNTPIILYRDNPSRAAYARNYVHFGPIEVNKSGTYKYYLWLGIWSTMQTSDVAEQRDSFESIVLIADGEPLLLDLAGWTPAAIETSAPVYPKPVASSMDAYYRVTADQIRVIAEAGDLQLRTTGPSPQEYGLWAEQKLAKQDLIRFLHRVAVY